MGKKKVGEDKSSVIRRQKYPKKERENINSREDEEKKILFLLSLLLEDSENYFLFFLNRSILINVSFSYHAGWERERERVVIYIYSRIDTLLYWIWWWEKNGMKILSISDYQKFIVVISSSSC